MHRVVHEGQTLHTRDGQRHLLFGFLRAIVRVEIKRRFRSDRDIRVGGLCADGFGILQFGRFYRQRVPIAHICLWFGLCLCSFDLYLHRFLRDRRLGGLRRFRGLLLLWLNRLLGWLCFDGVLRLLNGFRLFPGEVLSGFL